MGSLVLVLSLFGPPSLPRVSHLAPPLGLAMAPLFAEESAPLPPPSGDASAPAPPDAAGPSLSAPAFVYGALGGLAAHLVFLGIGAAVWYAFFAPVASGGDPWALLISVIVFLFVVMGLVVGDFFVAPLAAAMGADVTLPSRSQPPGHLVTSYLLALLLQIPGSALMMGLLGILTFPGGVWLTLGLGVVLNAAGLGLGAALGIYVSERAVAAGQEAARKATVRPVPETSLLPAAPPPFATVFRF